MKKSILFVAALFALTVFGMTSCANKQEEEMSKAYITIARKELPAQSGSASVCVEFNAGGAPMSVASKSWGNDGGFVDFSLDKKPNANVLRLTTERVGTAINVSNKDAMMTSLTQVIYNSGSSQQLLKTTDKTPTSQFRNNCAYVKYVYVDRPVKITGQTTIDKKYVYGAQNEAAASFSLNFKKEGWHRLVISVAANKVIYSQIDPPAEAKWATMSYNVALPPDFPSALN